jgi:fatty acid desaturase
MYVHIVQKLAIPADLLLLTGALVIIRRKPSDFRRVLRYVNWIAAVLVIGVVMTLLTAPHVPFRNAAEQAEIDAAIDRYLEQTPNSRLGKP